MKAQFSVLSIVEAKNIVMGTIMLLVTTLLLSACATLNDSIAGTPWRAYSGPQLPNEKVAIIKTSLMSDLVHEAYVLEIDNEQVGNIGGYIEALPGSHTLEVRIHEDWGWPGGSIAGSVLSAATEDSATGIITFEAQAGHIYIVDGKIVDGLAAIWIEDEKTRQIIAGSKS